MDDVRKHFTQFYQPKVGILGSTEAEKLLLKSDLSLVELFHEFSTIEKAEAFASSIRPGNSQNKIDAFSLENFSLHFIDLQILNKIDEKLPKKMITNMILNCVNRKSYKDNEMLKDVMMTSSYQNYIRVNNDFADDSPLSNHVNMMHAAIFVASIDEPNIVESLRGLKTKFDRLMQHKKSVRNYLIKPFNDEILKYYVILHTPGSKTKIANSENLEKDPFMQITFNNQGYNLLINSGQSMPLSLKTISYYHLTKGLKKPKSEPLNADPLSVNLLSRENRVRGQLEGKNRVNRQFFVYPSSGMNIPKRVSPLTKDDLMRVKDFVIAFVSNSLIPHLIQSYMQLSQNILKKNNPINIIKSAKNFFKIKMKRKSTLNQFVSESADPMSNVSQDVLQKQCADILFIVQEYALAKPIYYDLTRMNDVSSSSIRASSIELFEICIFLATGASSLNDMHIERLLVANQGRRIICRLMHSFSIMYYLENRYTDIVFLLSKFAEKLNNTEKAIIYEQAAEIYSGSTRKRTKSRARSFFFITAAKSYSVAKLPWHQASCLLKANEVLEKRSWTAITSSYLKNCVLTFSELHLYNDAYVFSMKLLEHVNRLSRSSQLQILPLISDLVANHQNKSVGVLTGVDKQKLSLIEANVILICQTQYNEQPSSECQGCLIDKLPLNVDDFTQQLFCTKTLRSSELCFRCLNRISGESSDYQDILNDILVYNDALSTFNTQFKIINFSKISNASDLILILNVKYKLQVAFKNLYGFKVIISSVVLKCSFTSSNGKKYVVDIPATMNNVEIESMSSVPIYFALTCSTEAVLNSVTCDLTLTFAKRSLNPGHQDYIQQDATSRLLQVQPDIMSKRFSSGPDLFDDNVGLNHDTLSGKTSLMTDYVDSIEYTNDDSSDLYSISSTMTDISIQDVSIGVLDDLDNHTDCKIDSHQLVTRPIDDNYSLRVSIKIDGLKQISFLSTSLKVPEIVINNWQNIRGSTSIVNTYLSVIPTHADSICYIHGLEMDDKNIMDNALIKVKNNLFKLSNKEFNTRIQPITIEKSEPGKLVLNTTKFTIFCCKSVKDTLQYAMYYFNLRYYNITLASGKTNFHIRDYSDKTCFSNFPCFDLSVNLTDRKHSYKNFELTNIQPRALAFTNRFEMGQLDIIFDEADKFYRANAICFPSISKHPMEIVQGEISQELKQLLTQLIQAENLRINDISIIFIYEMKHANLYHIDGTPCTVIDFVTFSIQLPPNILTCWLKDVECSSKAISRKDFSFKLDSNVEFNETFLQSYFLFEFWNHTDRNMMMKVNLIADKKNSSLLWNGKISHSLTVKPFCTDEDKISIKFYYNSFVSGIYPYPTFNLDLKYDDQKDTQSRCLYSIQIDAYKLVTL